jgi:hypothetical protein
MTILACVLSVVAAMVATYFSIASLQAYRQTRRIADALCRGQREAEAMRAAIAKAMSKQTVGVN